MIGRLLPVGIAHPVGLACPAGYGSSQWGIWFLPLQVDRLCRGVGINKKNLRRIFDRFFQEEKSRHAPGFGIGLSLVKKIAEEHGWEIKVLSQKGKGTLVKVFLQTLPIKYDIII